jgi:hypothetical protein
VSGSDTIGKRTYSECLRIFGSIKQATKTLGASSPVVIYRWGHDNSCPQAYYLAKLLKAGGDINYILIGGNRNEMP